MVLGAALALVGCGDSEPGSGDGRAGAGGQITVSAAASLTEAFTEIGEDFEEANPDADVRFNFAASSTLSRQVNEGAPVDVFASASREQMQKVTDAGNVAAAPTVFATNTLQIAVPPGNPARITGLADFGRQQPAIALCAEQVPCGAASQTALEAAGVTPAPDSLEQDVKAVLTKVALGEADAGLVYTTDVSSAGGDVEGIDFPAAADAVNEYPIAVMAEAPNPEGARAFVDYVLSDDGESVLGEYGFGIDVS